MASKPHYYLPLFLLIITLVNADSPRRREDADFDKWVSWNVQKHRERIAFSASPSLSGVKVTDDQLIKAELNKLRITVCQNGTGDFKNITDALRSIPSYNSRRVILDIKPGVYRSLCLSLSVYHWNVYKFITKLILMVPGRRLVSRKICLLLHF